MPLTREQLENTEWAKRFKEDSPASYAEALKLATQEDFEVGLHFTEDAGDWQWCIVTNGFWMDAFETRDQAVALCAEMNWDIAYEHNEQTQEMTEKRKPRVYAFKDGQKIKFNNHVLVGTGVIRGVATTDQPVIGPNYIIEVEECNVALPNETYPFRFMGMFGCHLEAC